MSDVRRGRLHDASAAPATGERTEPVVHIGNAVIEQILSGSVEPVDYDQDDDEFALVLAGAAVLDVDGERVELTASDWILLPAHTPHRLLQTERGTSWLTIRLSRE
jgi:mannose-6-phosphate isomerase-like protein (cupin superfamily)